MSSNNLAYRVQIVAFSERVDAENACGKLKASGFDAVVVAEDDHYVVQLGSYKKKGNAEKLRDKLDAAGFNAVVIDNTPTVETKGFEPYRVKVVANILRIRKGAGTNTEIVGNIADLGVYTIVEEANDEGSARWGKLESGAGWIALDYTKKI